MEQKTNALKTASRVISIITKILYTAMIVMLCICASMLIFLAVTGGDTSVLTVGGVNIIAIDDLSSTPAELAAICSVLLVLGSFFLIISLQAYRMFHEISLTGDPFMEKHARTIRVIGILTAVMPIAVGTTEGVIAAFSKTELPEMYSDAPGIVVGAIIYCLSFIIDYGYGLKSRTIVSEETSQDETMIQNPRS